jgi:DNA topoisomerase-2
MPTIVILDKQSLSGITKEPSTKQQVVKIRHNKSVISDDLKNEEYITLTERQRVLHRDMYAGSRDREIRKVKVYDIEKSKIYETENDMPQAMEQTFFEIAGNVADNIQRSRDIGLDPDKIELEMNDQWLVMTNYGRPIPVEISRQTGIYIPTMIFSTIGSGSNYDNATSGKTLIGMNGMGAKLTNIFSLEFIVECCDGRKTFRQKWTNNMTETKGSEVQDTVGAKPFTKISYKLDFERFDRDGYTALDGAQFAATCASISFLGQVPVIFNSAKINVPSIKTYADLFFGKEFKKIHHSSDNPNFELCIVDTPGVSVHMSFVNGMMTKKHGAHLDKALKILLTKIKEIVKLPDNITLRKNDIIDNVSVFVSIKVPNPKFVSQVKETYKSPDPKLSFPDNMWNKVKNWDLIKYVAMIMEDKMTKKLAKGERKRTGKRMNNPKINEANMAGKPKSECIAWLAEGDSAKTYITTLFTLMATWSATNIVPGNLKEFFPEGGGSPRDVNGIAPLSGKPPNAYKADFATLLNNKVFIMLKAFLGLREGVNYMDDDQFAKLRYKKVYLAVDADYDGKHIAALFLLWAIARFPTWVQRGCIYIYRTPILRVTWRGQTLKFFTDKAYAEWQDATPNWEKWNHSYFKGLASSEKHHILEDWLDITLSRFVMDDDALMNLNKCFGVDTACARKDWLRDFDPSGIVDVEKMLDLSISIFLNDEMIFYSIDDNARSLPAMDGLKEGQRMGVYSMRRALKNPKKKMKTIQAATESAGECKYTHAEQSQAVTVASMSSTFTGHNNIEYFKAKSQTSTREQGPRKIPSVRYTYIADNPIWRCINRVEDERIMTRLKREGNVVEYSRYYPIIPGMFINPITGIGTAYSSTLHPFYPPHLVQWIKQRLEHNDNVDTKTVDFIELVPYYTGFRGVIMKTKNGFSTHGMYHIVDYHEVDTKKKISRGDIIVDELPVGIWNSKYEHMLTEMIDAGTIKSFFNRSTDDNPMFIIKGWSGDPVSEKTLKLTKTKSFNNMVILVESKNGLSRPVEFDTSTDIMEHFYLERLEKYRERVKIQTDEKKNELAYMTERRKFIFMVMDEELVIFRRKKAQVITDMKTAGFTTFDHIDKVLSSKYTEEELAKLDDSLEFILSEIKELGTTNPKDVWTRELDEFLVVYNKKYKAAVPPVYTTPPKLDLVITIGGNKVIPVVVPRTNIVVTVG